MLCRIEIQLATPPGLPQFGTIQVGPFESRLMAFIWRILFHFVCDCRKLIAGTRIKPLHERCAFNVNPSDPEAGGPVSAVANIPGFFALEVRKTYMALSCKPNRTPHEQKLLEWLDRLDLRVDIVRLH